MNFTCNKPVTAVIVNYNSGPLLASCVHAVLQQVRQVVVVDNASSDMSLTELENKLSSEKLHIVRLHDNVGFAAGCNAGFKLSTQSLILFLNPDCILQENSMQRMVQVIESDTHIGMVGGFLVNPDGSEQGGGRRAIPTPWRAFVRAFGLYRLEKFWPYLFLDFHLNNKPLPHGPIEVEAISGALMLVKREAIDDVGLWDENYFLHCEDLDLCMRFKQKKWKIVFIPDAPVVQTILKVIEKVHDGELWLDRETASRTFLQNFHMRKTASPSINTRKISALTRKECEILKVFSQASGSEQNKQIAAYLQMSEYTLRNHLSAIFKKLGINNRFGLFMYARKHFRRSGFSINKVLQ